VFSISMGGHSVPPQQGWRSVVLLASIRQPSSCSRALTWIGAPFKRAPAPATAVKHSSVSGLYTAAATGLWSSTTAAQIVKCGLPFKKADVPSIGSTTKTRLSESRAASSSVSSDSQPYPGRAGRRRSFRKRSTARSASDTGLPSGLPRTLLFPSGTSWRWLRRHVPLSQATLCRRHAPATVMPSMRQVGALVP